MSFECAVPLRAGKVATAEQVREFDRRAVQEFGVPSIELMENAGRHVFEAARGLLADVDGNRVAVIAGRGNNGGDGFVAARHLRDAGVDVDVYLLGDPAEVRGDAKVNLDILLKTGHQVQWINSASQLNLAECVIVDAIFGTGLKGEITGLAADAINAVNASNQPAVAVDLPSGLDADSGEIWGVCVNADCTVTFALPKIGLLTYPGAACVGNLLVGDIGIPKQLYDEINVEVADDQWVADRLPARPPDANKGTFGTAVVIAGSPGYTGAAAMASMAVLRSGAGLSMLAVAEGLQDIMAAKLTEVITHPLPQTADRAISSEAVAPALEFCKKAKSVVLGCGLGTHDETCRFVHEFVRSIDKPAVVDADGLNCLSKDVSILEGPQGELVLTPHPGEMSRLIGTGIPEIQSNRLDTAREAASRFHSVVVLKGARTLIADPSGRVFINMTGNVGMASGGTGDVLAGIIGGLLAQGMSTFEAAVCGVYIHGKAGDIAACELGETGMIAGDLLEAVPYAITEVQGGQSCDHCC